MTEISELSSTARAAAKQLQALFRFAELLADAGAVEDTVTSLGVVRKDAEAAADAARLAAANAQAELDALKASIEATKVEEAANVALRKETLTNQLTEMLEKAKAEVEAIKGGAMMELGKATEEVLAATAARDKINEEIAALTVERDKLQTVVAELRSKLTSI